VNLQKGLITVIARTETLSTSCFRSSFLKLLETHPEGEIIAAEIGVYEGVNSKFMLLACDRMKLYLVDAWDNLVVYTGGPIQGKAFSDMIKGVAQLNLSGFENNAVFTNKNSLDAVKDYPDEYFDYVYIDGDHEHDPVLADLRAWWPKVKTGGILGGHDVAMEEVRQALDEFVAENGILKNKYDTDKSNNEGRSDFWILK